MSFRNLLILLTGFSLLSACSTTNREKQLERVKSGMTKEQVLGITGNPSRSSRVQGADKWSYDIFDSEKRRVDVIDVYFTNGTVDIVGSEESLKAKFRQSSTPDSNDNGFRDL